MAMKSYKVLRHMVGDKPYVPGDLREMDEHDARHLVERGSLVLLDSNEAKADLKAKADSGKNPASAKARGGRASADKTAAAAKNKVISKNAADHLPENESAEAIESEGAIILGEESQPSSADDNQETN